MNNQFKNEIDKRLSTLTWTEQHSLALLQEIKGETIVKKKISLSLVLALVLALVAVSALAVGLWKNYYNKMAQTEGETGYFDTWSGEKRADFVLDMAQEGVTFNPDALEKLADKNTTDTEKSSIATQLLIEKYGFREDTITAISIMEAEKGPLPRWSLEDKAKYTKMLQETGTLGSDEEMYWLPEEGDLALEEAISLADKAIMDTYGVKEDAFAGLDKIGELRSYAHEPENKVWRVFYLEPGQDVYAILPIFEAMLDAATGKVTSTSAKNHQPEEYSRVPSAKEIELDQRFISAFKEARPYTAEGLANLVREFAPKLKELENFRKDWGGYYEGYRHVLTQDIRSPEDGMTSLADARKTAQEAILLLPGWTRERLEMFEPFAEVYYYSKSFDKPVYLFIYSWKSSNSMTEEEMENPSVYGHSLFEEFAKTKSSPPASVSVYIDAKTGQMLGEVKVEELSGLYPPGMMELTYIR